MLAPRLSDAYRVIAIDQRGYGLSDKPYGGYDLRPLLLTSDAILNAQKIGRAVLAGHCGAATSRCNTLVESSRSRARLVLNPTAASWQVGDRIDGRLRRSS